VIFLLGLFWKKASEAGAIAAAIASVVLSYLGKQYWPDLPFIDRMGLVFLASALLAIAISLARPAHAERSRIDTGGIDFSTSRSFNVAALGVIAILVALYATWW